MVFREMQNRVQRTTEGVWRPWVLLALGLILLLAPWWRNHGFLRDFYDYGLVMAGIGRIEAGESLYRDFVTPIQSGIFLANGWAERLGDGTYQAMTRGAAVLTALGFGLLAFLWSRRWPPGAAVVLAIAWTTMTLAQHTIIWHNTLAALTLAIAACGAAVAPIWRRSTWPWHVAVAGALMIGGLTKLNAHVVAMVAVVAWALQAVLSRKAGKLEFVRTLGLIGLFAVVLPVAIELAWTGASPATWWYNVVVLPFGARTGELASTLDGKFYLTIRHDYYGAMPLPQLGLVAMLGTVAFVGAGLSALGRAQAIWVIGSALFAAASGAALLATNHEIAYVAIGTWFSLLVSLWLGFGLRTNGGWFYGGLLAPMLLVGLLAWVSAWQGQRSQFGYSLAPREEYVEAGSIAPDFAYLHGTFLPPDVSASLQATVTWRNSLPLEERATVFYGPGLEWLERVWPVIKLPNMPLWMHGGTSYGVAEQALFAQAIAGAGPYQHLLVTDACDYWLEETKAEFYANYLKKRMGPVWVRYDKQPPGRVSWRPINFLLTCGGNTNSSRLISAMKELPLGEGRFILGLERGQGELQILDPSYRMQGVAVLKSLAGKATDPAATVRFEAFAVAGTDRYPRWSMNVSPPSDGSELAVPFPLDSGGLPVLLRVSIPTALDGCVMAGWRDLKFLDTVDGPAMPMKMWPAAAEAALANETERARLLPAGWEPPAVYLRDARAGANGLELSPGGEIWIRLKGRFAEISGVAAVADDIEMGADPVVRVFYCKQAKLETLTQRVLSPSSRTFEFKAWSGEADGWLVVSVDPTKGAPTVSVRLRSAKRAE